MNTYILSKHRVKGMSSKHFSKLKKFYNVLIFTTVMENVINFTIFCENRNMSTL